MAAMTDRRLLTPDQLLTTTRSVRRRLDFDRPVARELIEECIEVATQAPTGSNRQGWHFVVVADAARKRGLADLYRQSWEPYSRLPAPAYAEGDVRGRQLPAVLSSSQYLADNLHRAPYLVIPCIWGRLPEGAPTLMQASHWGSILPAAWSLMLAARARGLGSAWTTLHLAYEREAAELLGIPYQRCTQAGLFPIAHHAGETFRPAARIPLQTILHWDAW